MASIYYTFDFGDCVMAAMVESPFFPVGVVVEFRCGIVGQLVSQYTNGSLLAYRIQNVKYLHNLMAAETAIETLRREGWKRIATLRDGKLVSLGG